MPKPSLSRRKPRVIDGPTPNERKWEEILTSWRRSGQTGRAFCRAQGLREPAFYFWKRQLRLRPALRARTKTPPPPGPASVSTPTWLPVRVSPLRLSADADALELRLPSGHVLRVPRGFDAETLREVLAVLESSGAASC